MPSAYILDLISRMQVRPQPRPQPLFQGDVDSNDSDIDDADGGDATIAEETMPTQGPEGSGEVNLAPIPGLLDLEGYVDMREPWVEGAKGEKVCLSEWFSESSLTKCSVFGYRWLIIRTPSLASSHTEV